MRSMLSEQPDIGGILWVADFLVDGYVGLEEGMFGLHFEFFGQGFEVFFHCILFLGFRDVIGSSHLGTKILKK